jgi:hypothetical protein
MLIFSSQMTKPKDVVAMYVFVCIQAFVIILFIISKFLVKEYREKVAQYFFFFEMCFQVSFLWCTYSHYKSIINGQLGNVEKVQALLPDLRKTANKINNYDYASLKNSINMCKSTESDLQNNYNNLQSLKTDTIKSIAGTDINMEMENATVNSVSINKVPTTIPTLAPISASDDELLLNYAASETFGDNYSCSKNGLITSSYILKLKDPFDQQAAAIIYDKKVDIIYYYYKLYVDTPVSFVGLIDLNPDLEEIGNYKIKLGPLTLINYKNFHKIISPNGDILFIAKTGDDYTICTGYKSGNNEYLESILFPDGSSTVFNTNALKESPTTTLFSIQINSSDSGFSGTCYGKKLQQGFDFNAIDRIPNMSFYVKDYNNAGGNNTIDMGYNRFNFDKDDKNINYNLNIPIRETSLVHKFDQIKKCFLSTIINKNTDSLSINKNDNSGIDVVFNNAKLISL